MKKSLFVFLLGVCLIATMFGSFFALSGCKSGEYKEFAGSYSTDRITAEGIGYWVGTIELSASGKFSWIRINKGETESEVKKLNGTYPTGKYVTGSYTINGSVFTIRFTDYTYDVPKNEEVVGSITEAGNLKIRMSGVDTIYKQKSSGGGCGCGG